VAALANPAIDLVALEKDRIKGAIRTDFILSAEIIVISLGTMSTASMSSQIVALSFVAIAVTLIVYGLVAGIVKLDDFGLRLHKTPDGEAAAEFKQRFGAWILRAAPYFMRTLSIVGTAAMFMVGGSIIVHGIAPLEHVISDVSAAAGAQMSWLGAIVQLLLEALTGVIAGGIVVGIVTLGKRMFGKSEKAAH
jgi:hypothetical protein